MDKSHSTQNNTARQYRSQRSPNVSPRMKTRRFNPYTTTNSALGLYPTPPITSPSSASLLHRSTGTTKELGPSPSSQSPIEEGSFDRGCRAPRAWSNSSSHTPSPLTSPSLRDLEPLDSSSLPSGIRISHRVQSQLYQATMDGGLLADDPALDLTGLTITISANTTELPVASSVDVGNSPVEPFLAGQYDAMGIFTLPNHSDNFRNADDLSGDSRSLFDNLYEPSTPSSGGINEENAVLSISTAFHPGSHTLLPPPDVIIVSSDETLFYVHAATLLTRAPSVFQDVLANDPLAPLLLTPPVQNADGNGNVNPGWFIQPCPQNSSSSQIWLKIDIFPADELNVMLHAFYNTSCAAHQPPIDTLEKAIDKMAAPLSIPVSQLIRVGTELFNYLLSLAPLHPLRIYALAAKHSIHDLAVKTSSHLLSFTLSMLTDADVQRIGAVYLKKLVLLHVERIQKLRDLLLKPPLPHAPTKKCNFNDQRGLEGMWAGVVVNLAWDVRPDLSTASLQRALEPIKERLECAQCREALSIRIKDVLRSWASVKHTIS